MRLFLGLLLFIFSVNSIGLTTHRCYPVQLKTDHKNIILSVDETHKSPIFFIYNLSNQSLWLDHPTEKKGVSAGWASYLRKNKWSALFLDRKNFAISCAVIEPGAVNYKDCTLYISVCSFPNAKYESKRKGSYWLGEDKDLNTLFSNLAKRGVTF